VSRPRATADVGLVGEQAVDASTQKVTCSSIARPYPFGSVPVQ
jgi:hypothetical protein